jgi:large-conductance mechanosensitive channel
MGRVGSFNVKAISFLVLSFIVFLIYLSYNLLEVD